MHLLRERRRRKRREAANSRPSAHETEKCDEEKKINTSREAWSITPNDAPNILKKKLSPSSLRSRLKKQRSKRAVREKADYKETCTNRSDDGATKDKSRGWEKYHIAAGM